MSTHVCGNFFPAHVGSPAADSYTCTHPVGHDGEHQNVDQWGYVCATWADEGIASERAGWVIAEQTRLYPSWSRREQLTEAHAVAMAVHRTYHRQGEGGKAGLWLQAAALITDRLEGVA